MIEHEGNSDKTVTNSLSIYAISTSTAIGLPLVDLASSAIFSWLPTWIDWRFEDVGVLLLRALPLCAYVVLGLRFMVTVVVAVCNVTALPLIAVTFPRMR